MAWSEETLTCACVDADERRCFEVRYYGMSPTLENEYGESCECSCHFQEEDDDE
jgi:hypothetical protein